MTARKLATFRVTFDITLDTLQFSSPDLWNWQTLLDPNLEPGLYFTVPSIIKKRRVHSAHEWHILEDDAEIAQEELTL